MYKIPQRLKDFANKYAPVINGVVKEFKFYEVEDLRSIEGIKASGRFDGDWSINMESNPTRSDNFMDLVFLHELGHAVAAQAGFTLNHDDNEKLASTLAIAFAKILDIPVTLDFLKKENLEFYKYFNGLSKLG